MQLGLRAGAETSLCGAPMPAPSVSVRTGLCQLPASLLSNVQRELTKDRGFQVALESPVKTVLPLATHHGVLSLLTSPLQAVSMFLASARPPCGSRLSAVSGYEPPL